MSDNFIPLNQSTPVHNPKRWQVQIQTFQLSGQRGGWGQSSSRGGFHKQNNSNSSHGRDQGIDAYLHPSMLQDPWAYLRRKNAENQQT